MLHLHLQRLHVFWNVARFGSFSRAAEELHLSQPTLSLQVRELERALGQQLFDRLGKRIYLTEAGRTLQEYAGRIFALTDEAQTALDDIRGLRRGHIAVGASTTFGIYVLPRAMATFRRRYPGIDLQLSVANAQRVQQQILANDVQLGFIGGSVSSPQLEARPLLLDELVVVVGPDHAWAKRREVAPEELVGQAFILRERGSGTREVLESRLAERGLRLDVRLEMGSTEAIKQAVAVDLGISIVSRYTVAWEVDAGRLCAVRVPALGLTRQLSLVRRRDRRPTRAEAAFLAVVAEPGVVV